MKQSSAMPKENPPTLVVGSGQDYAGNGVACFSDYTNIISDIYINVEYAFSENVYCH